MEARFINERLARIQWQSKLAKYYSIVDQQIALASSSAHHQPLGELSQTRLQHVVKALQTQKKEVRVLLEEFNFEKTEAEASLQALLSQRIPSRQHVLSYFLNVFRDWAWATQENNESLEVLKSLQLNTDHLTVLGSGAGRLAYDLAQNNMVNSLTLLDINPLLLSISKKMWNGEKISLTEVNEFPFSNENLAKTWSLCPPASPMQPTKWIWGDALHLPFENSTLESVLTPWLIDVLPEDFSVFAQRLNSRLKPGGTWFNMGPLGFGGAQKKTTYTKEEIEYILTESGFKIEIWLEKRIPYLNSPLSSQWREETVLAWRAKKIADRKAPPEYSAYPDWLLNPQQKIPRLEEFQSLATQTQLELQILLSINGQRSLSDIQKLMTPHLKINAAAAENLLLTFFSIYFEKSF